LVNGLQCLAQFRGILAAGLRHVWFATATAADQRRDAFDDVAGGILLDQIAGHRGEQNCAARARRAEHDDAGTNLIAQTIRKITQPAIVDAFDLGGEHRNAVNAPGVAHEVVAPRAGQFALQLLELLFEVALLRDEAGDARRDLVFRAAYQLADLAQSVSLKQAIWEAMGLKYLDGGGEGCTYPDAKPSFARRNFHHVTFYGFLLCFAATTVATIYHYVFGWKAPYPLWSLPVLLGSVGGAGLLIGPAGLMWLKFRRDPQLTDSAQTGMDVGFLVLLFLVSLTGLLLLMWRESPAMGVLLAIHLGAVLALFLTLPYGKFVHALYRLAALLRFHIERRRPLPAIGAE